MCRIRNEKGNRIRFKLQFSLSTMIIATAVVLVTLLIGIRCVQNTVSQVSLEGGRLIIHFTDDSANRVFGGDPYAFSWEPEGDDANSEVFFHDVYVSLPVYTVLGTLVFALGVFVAAYLAWNKRQRRCPK